MANKKTTLIIDPELESMVQGEADKAGVPWATMLKMLAREAVATRRARQ